MRPWLPAPLEAWPELAEWMMADGRPWPEFGVIVDLRWHVDQGLPIPGRPTLSRRWSWTDWAVKVLLRDEARWRDPLAASRPPADRQPTASPATAEPGQSGRFRQPTASRPPADRHARVDPPSQPPSQLQVDESEDELLQPAQEVTMKPSSIPDDQQIVLLQPPGEVFQTGITPPGPNASCTTESIEDAELGEVSASGDGDLMTALDWRVISAAYRRLAPGFKGSLAGTVAGKAIRARVRETSVDAVRLVLRWARESEADQGPGSAPWLRQNGYATASTLFAPTKWERRVALATAWAEEHSATSRDDVPVHHPTGSGVVSSAAESMREAIRRRKAGGAS